jgi:hypothetical protein
MIFQGDVRLDLEICGIGILLFLLIVVLLIVFIALPLYLTARLLDEDEGILKAFGASILCVLAFVLTSGFGLIGFFIAVVVNLFIIKQVYETFWDRAVAMWIITIIIAIVIVSVILAVANLGNLLNRVF